LNTEDLKKFVILKKLDGTILGNSISGGQSHLIGKIESRDLGKFSLYRKESCGLTAANVKRRAILLIKDQFVYTFE